jgi:hypothetical protein
MSFTAYLDESGIHDGSEAVTVAGYLSTPERWEAFKTEWKLALNEFGIRFFRMSQFANRAREYQTWTEEQRSERFARLVTIINHHVFGSYGIGIPRKLFDKFFPPKASRSLGSAYALAAYNCFIMIAEDLDKQGIRGGIAYVFESGCKGRGQINEIFKKNKQDPALRKEYRLLSLDFKDKKEKEFVALQAADILAYELYRFLPVHLGMNKYKPRDYNLEPLAAVAHRWEYVGESELRKWAIVQRSLNRAARGQLP